MYREEECGWSIRLPAVRHPRSLGEWYGGIGRPGEVHLVPPFLAESLGEAQGDTECQVLLSDAAPSDISGVTSPMSWVEDDDARLILRGGLSCGAAGANSAIRRTDSQALALEGEVLGPRVGEPLGKELCREDRKSTRLNSSPVAIAYAVFCLKKKN